MKYIPSRTWAREAPSNLNPLVSTASFCGHAKVSNSARPKPSGALAGSGFRCPRQLVSRTADELLYYNTGQLNQYAAGGSYLDSKTN